MQIAIIDCTEYYRIMDVNDGYEPNPEYPACIPCEEFILSTPGIPHVPAIPTGVVPDPTDPNDLSPTPGDGSTTGTNCRVSGDCEFGAILKTVFNFPGSNAEAKFCTIIVRERDTCDCEREHIRTWDDDGLPIDNCLKFQYDNVGTDNSAHYLYWNSDLNFPELFGSEGMLTIKTYHEEDIDDDTRVLNYDIFFNLNGTEVDFTKLPEYTEGNFIVRSFEIDLATVNFLDNNDAEIIFSFDYSDYSGTWILDHVELSKPGEKSKHVTGYCEPILQNCEDI
jgi:hypothetical protein